jgi:hypothetical protein
MSEQRCAIEALRAGVPNRAAIRLLGTTEIEVTTHFADCLEACRQGLKRGEQPVGQIIAGGFGTGKSHLLGYLQQFALDRNFLVSWLVISKETPLYDVGKLYLSALRNTAVPGANDDAMTAVLWKLQPKNEAFDNLALWAESPAAHLSPLFPALLHLLPHQSTDQERLKQIARFLSGGKLSFAHVRQWLREVGAVKLYSLKMLKAQELVRQRLRFVPRLIAAAGYSGWVVLFDEVELIGRYSVLQRGRSYAELARWLGLDSEEKIPGVAAVAAISDDFIENVMWRRRDDEQVPLKLNNRNERETAERARLGMEALERKKILLRSPTAAYLESSLDKIRALYADAYGWNGSTRDIGEISTTKSMRQFIKSWITAWDLERLYGIRPEIQTESIVSDYEENRDIEASSEQTEDAE